jgi:hypothetical protein
MKFLKYIVFVPILSSVFFLLYRQSDKASLHKWFTYIKIVAFVAAILAGLIQSNIEPCKGKSLAEF